MRTTGEVGLRDVLERDDGQMLASGSVADAKLDVQTRPSPNERVRLRVRGVADNGMNSRAFRWLSCS